MNMVSGGFLLSIKFLARIQAKGSVLMLAGIIFRKEMECYKRLSLIKDIFMANVGRTEVRSTN